MTHNYPERGDRDSLEALARLTRALRVDNHLAAIRRNTPPRKITRPGTGAHRPERLGPFAVPVAAITNPPTIHTWDTNPFPCCTTEGTHR